MVPCSGLPAFRPGDKVDLSGEVRSSGAAATTGADAFINAAAAGVSVAKGSNKVTLSSLDDDC